MHRLQILPAALALLTPCLLACGIEPALVHAADALRFEFSEEIGFGAGAGSGQFASPSGIAVGDVDRDGWPDVFVADTGNNRIQRINFNTPTGDPDFDLLITGLSAPKGIDVDTQRGLVFVSDTGNNVVLHKDVRDGFLDGQVAEPGSGLGEVNAPHGLSVCCGGGGGGGGTPGSPETRQLFIADTGNNRIQKLSLTLYPDNIQVHPEPLLMVRGTGPGQVESPAGVVGADFDRDGLADRLFVADTGNSRIQRVTFDPVTGDPDFDLLMGPGTDLGKVSNPPMIKLWWREVLPFTVPETLIVVADTGNNRIQVGTDKGNNINWSFLAGPGTGPGQVMGPEGLAIGDINRDGRPDVLVADTGNNRLLLFAGVPEPSTLGLAAFAVSALAFRRRRCAG